MARYPSTRRSLIIAAAACAFAFATVAVVGLVGWLSHGTSVIMPVVIGAAATAALAGFWILIGLLSDHFDGLEQLRGRLVMMRAEATGGARADHPMNQPKEDGETARLADAAFALAEVWREARTAPDERLAAIIGAVPEGMLSITETGLISLVNAPALHMLGAQRAALGTSVFAALDDRDVRAAWRDARRRNRPARTMLRHAEGFAVAARIVDMGPGHGALILIEASGAMRADLRGGPVRWDTGLHETPPPPEPIDDDMPLDRLPAWVLDLETTGLDARSDRIVSIGGVRQHGGRLFRGSVIDQLINPERPIPAASSAIHGITDLMVVGAPRFADSLPALAAQLGGFALVGHNIGFDLTVLRSEARRGGADWPVPPALDTFLLAAALEPSRVDLNLESLADAYGAPVTARHTALGDCLTTGEVYARLLPRLAERGITTVGAARAFSRSARRALAAQRANGWITP